MSIETEKIGLVQSATRPQNRKLGIGLVLLATTCWSTTGLLIDVLSRDFHMTALQLSFWRTFILAALMALVVWQRQGWQGFRLSRRELALYIVNGVIGIAVFNVVWSNSVQVNGAAVATTLIYCSPAFVALGAWPILGEKIGLDRAIAVAVNILGCALVSGAYDPATLFRSPQGLLLGLASGLTFALYTLLSKITSRDSQRSAMSNLFYLFLFGSAVILPWGLIVEGPTVLTPALDLTGWLLLALLAYGPTLGGYVFFAFSLKHLPAAVASLFTTLEPPITAILSLILLGRGMSLIQWVGALLIVSGVMGLQLNAVRLTLRNRKI
jgi:drug/metabolite transporter (DMT)-like permease